MDEPSLLHRDAVHYLGIRTRTPFHSMFAVVSLHLKELRRWLVSHELIQERPFLLRYHVINMAGLIDIEVGFVVPAAHPGDEKVHQSEIPVGLYATLPYRGSDVKAIWAQLVWSERNGIVWGTVDTRDSEAFVCCYVSYRTDYRIEPRKKQWDVELAVKVRDATRRANQLPLLFPAVTVVRKSRLGEPHRTTDRFEISRTRLV